MHLATPGVENHIVSGQSHTDQNKNRHSDTEHTFQSRITGALFFGETNVNLACFLIICKHIMIFLCFITVKKLHTDPQPPANSVMWMYNGASWWGQAFDHWCLAVFFVEYTWLYKGVTFVFLLSFPLPLPFDWTLRCWVCVCCFILLYSGYYVMLCVKKINKKLLITKKKWHTAPLRKPFTCMASWSLILKLL